MRLLEYRQDLFGRGYSVISGNKHYDEMHAQECLPIKMYRMGLPLHSEPCDFFEDLVGNLRFNWDSNNGTEEEHRKKYADILLDRGPEWIIIAFQVSVGEVTLDFYNVKTRETCFFTLKADRIGFGLRFEVPHTDGKSCSVYDVDIGGVESAEENACTTITEYINHVRREIEFFRKSSNSDETYIEVTEYADL